MPLGTLRTLRKVIFNGRMVERITGIIDDFAKRPLGSLFARNVEAYRNKLENAFAQLPYFLK